MRASILTLLREISTKELHVNRTQISLGVSRVAGSLLLVSGLLGGVPALHGQSDPAPQQSEQASSLKRFSLGGRVSILAINLMNNELASSSTSEPPVKTTLTSASVSNQLGGGATLQFAVHDRLALSVDFLYRRAGYKAGFDRVEGVDDPETEEDERIFTSSFEQTRADYWDVPVLLRIYDSGRRKQGARAFVNGGVAIRFVKNLRTFREFTLPDGSIGGDETPADPANTTLKGVVFGAGWQFGSKVGLKVMPEVRYTRWLGHTFDTPPTRSKRHQVEFLFGITF
jgi:hypothetical protein